MPHTFASLLVHVVFSTKNRAPDLPAEPTGRLFPYMGGIVKELKGTALTPPGGGYVGSSTRPTACAVGWFLPPFGLASAPEM
jgi:hypothetical protein